MLRGQDGFTLIEAMVAMLIAAIMLLAMAQMLITGMKTNQQSEHRMDAAALANSAMANAIVQASNAGYSGGVINYTSVPSGKATVTVAPSPTVVGQEVMVNVVFTWKEHGKTKTINLFNHAVTE